MLTSLFFLLLLGFQLWYLTSPQVKLQPIGYQAYIVRNPRPARLIGGVLVLGAAVLFVLTLGWATGLCAWLVGLMGVGSLVVALGPFRFLNTAAVVLLYVFFLTLEVVL